jgi:Tol biopolymer transport system component
LLQLGICYEKLGSGQAQQAYRQLIKEYSENREEVSVARNRLAKLELTLADLKSKPYFRKIDIATEPSNGVLSSDGKKLAFTSENGLWVVPLQGNVDTDIAGEPVRITEIPGATNFYNVLAWSADGKWIAVSGGLNGADEVYIVPTAGGDTRKVNMPKRDGGYLSSRLSLSSDGEYLAFSARKQDLNEEKPIQALYVYTVTTRGGEPRQISSGPGIYPSFSPDGQFIVYITIHEKEKPPEKVVESRFYSDLWVVNSSGGTPIRLGVADGQLAGPVWSPDGRFLAVTGRVDAGGKEILIYKLQTVPSGTAEPVRIELPGYSLGMLTGWTPEGSLGVFIRGHYRTAIYTVPSSGGRAVQVTPEGIMYYPRWSPDGNRIYLRWVTESEVPPVKIAFVPAVGGDVTKVPWPEDALTSRVPGGGHNISPDGRNIVVSAVKRPSGKDEPIDLRVIPLDNDMPVRRLTNDESHETYPCWSPDGNWITFVDLYKSPEGRDFNAIYRIPSKGGEIMKVTSSKDSIGEGAIAFSPDGKRIAFFSEGMIKTIPFNGGEPEVLVTDVQSSRHSQLDWSPDGTKIAYTAKGKVWITILSTGEKSDLKTGLPKDFYIDEFDWSPDGQKITFMTTSGDEPEFWLISDFLPQDKK